MAFFCSLNSKSQKMKFNFLLSLLLLTQECFTQISPILPAPVTYKEMDGSLYFTESLDIDFSGLPVNLKDQMIELATVYHDIKLSIDLNKPRVRFKKLVNVIKESYSINISDEVIISYSSEASGYYAFNSFMQLIEKDSVGFKLKKCFVKDYPKFSWRGLHLDVSRHFFTVDEVKRYIDLMSFYKFNTFHWHLTDDQGWRIEIKSFPKLTQIGAWRDSTLNNHYSTKPRTFNKERYGGYYTQEQIKEVVSYANSKYITIVPEIEMPGHSRAALAAYPEYSCNTIQQGVEGLWGVFDDIFCSKDETIVFLQKVLDEVLVLFPGEYIHIGGDEAPKTRWKKCEKCQNVMKENNLKDEHQLQSYFIQRMDKYLTEKGRKLIGWDEILEGGLSSNAAVMSWRGFEGGVEAANLGHFVVMSPGSHCYFDHYQGKGKDEPLAIGGYTALEKVYDFNPVPTQLNKQQEPYILGGQANVWTEYIADFKKVEYMVYPRAIALSQSLWCSEKPSFKDFQKVLIDRHIRFLQKNNVNFSKSFISPEIQWKNSKKGIKFKVLPIDLSSKIQVKLNEENLDGKSQQREIQLIENQWFEINRAQKGNSVRNLSIVTGKNSFPSNFLIHSSASLGVPIKFITKPSPSYNSGDLTLVDGQHGALPWRGNEWIGFDTTAIELEIDLLKKENYNYIKLSFLKDDHAWIHFPLDIEISIFENGKWKIIESKPAISFASGGQVQQVKIELKKSTRFMHIRIKSLLEIPNGLPGSGHVPWTFIDEIEVVR